VQIAQLQTHIEQLKLEYAALIAEKGQIEQQLKSVKERIERATLLILNLSSEKYRWSGSSLSFKLDMATLLGNSLVAAAFLCYVGFFDYFYRRQLLGQLKSYLILSAYIQTSKELDLSTFLSSPEERLG